MSDRDSRWRFAGDVIAAHVEMLRRVGLIDDDAAETLSGAIDRVAGQSSHGGADLIDIVREFDSRIETQAPASTAGVSLVARGVIDIAATVARLELRDGLIGLDEELGSLRGELIDFAGTHVVSVMPILIDGAVAQPGTIAHWLGGLIAPLGRAHDRLFSAVEQINRSPLGAGSHASSALENDRDASAELLAFDGPSQSTFDAVASTDHFTSAADAAAAITSPLSRWLRELIILARTEPSSLRLSEAWRTTLADQPQFDAPTGIETLAIRCEATFECARRVASAELRTPFAPVAARLTSLLDESTRAITETREILTGLRDLLATGLEFNRAYLANRAGRAFSTASDLIDFLMIEERQDPQAARAIAALTISRARELGVEASGITPELIDGAALLVIGQELKVEFETISRYLAPRRFIERRTAVGAPSPGSIRTYILMERAKLERDAAWRVAAAGAIERVARDR